MKQTLKWSIIGLIAAFIVIWNFNTWKLKWQIGKLDDKIEEAKYAGIYCLHKASTKYYFKSASYLSLYSDEDGRYIGLYGLSGIFGSGEYNEPTPTEAYYDRKTDSIVGIVDSLFKERRKLIYILNTHEREKRQQKEEKLKNKYNIQ